MVSLLTLLPVLAGCHATEPESERPSVLLVTLDTTRADRLGAYGHPLAVTPDLDALAEQGTRFARAYATCPLTIPSHSTIFTGQVPPTHGVRDNGDFVLPEQALTLAERFSEAGWSTAAFTAAFPTQRRWGFGQGFDVYHDPLSRRPTLLDWRDQRRADEVVDDALEVLPGLEGPVFAWVHLFDPHWPYDPPEPWASEHQGRPYDGEIAFASSQVGRLLDWWDAHHDPSLVVVTADHGEGLGDGGEQTHGFLLHDGTVRVPLLVRGPGFAPGAVVHDPVSHVDLAPTLLAAAGLPLHPGLQGRDLREGGSDLPYSESLTGQYNMGLAPLHAYTDAEGRYTEGAWGAWYSRLGDVVLAVPEGGADTTRQSGVLQEILEGSARGEAERASLDADSLQLLAALGYVGGDPTAEAGDIDPRDVIDILPLTWRARHALGQHRLQAAHAAILRLEQRMPDTFGVDLLRAQLLRAQGRLPEAAERYADLFLRSPSSTVALQLASIASARGRWADAEDWYREALELQPASPEAMAGLVHALQSGGQVALAQELALEYLLVYPDHAELRLIRAEMLLLDERSADAVVEARAALESMPYSPWAHAVTARALWEAGEADEAIALLQEALRLDPWDGTVRLRLGECLLEVGRHAEAVRVLAPLARLVPDDPLVADRYREAREALEAERSR